MSAPVTYRPRQGCEVALLAGIEVGVVIDVPWDTARPAAWIMFLPCGPYGKRMESAQRASSTEEAKRALERRVGDWIEAAGLRGAA